MAKFSHKIEEMLEKVSSQAKFDPKASSVIELEEDFQSTISFPRILDFTFPNQLPGSSATEIGEVVYSGDGVCHVSGLDEVNIDDIVEIKTEHGIEKALVLGLQENRIDAVVLGEYSHIKRGDPARSTKGKLNIPVGRETLGRVINPLGIPLDGLGPIHAKQSRDVESAAPGVVDRVPILQPLQTGIMAIDATIPIGKGQRELVIGDRKTGKSRTMLDIISNQNGKNVRCVYVGVGLQAAKAKAALQLLTARGAMKYTTMLISFSDDPPSIQYLAPYAGTAIAEYYMYQGHDTLIIYDDLSKQAKAYRQVSLLLKRSPGRDAYPGDIFFLHSRLLERAAKLNPALGSGSLTALPIAETQQGDISDYIITNLMSITDGHIYLDANMMHEGIMPAINSGASVSRIGSKVQSKLLRLAGDASSRILARYNEVKSFETINTEVTQETMREIKRGRRVRDVLSQDSNVSMNDLEEIVVLTLATSARMDHFNDEQVTTFKDKFIHFFRQIELEPLEKAVESAKKIEDIDPYLDRILNSFCRKYQLPSIPIPEAK
jgi:F-type H+/Na+-transporting ATPase subunit alpha